MFIKKTGTPDSDIIVGTAKNDRLSGVDGDDAINVSSGHDRLDGGTGSDLLAIYFDREVDCPGVGRVDADRRLVFDSSTITDSVKQIDTEFVNFERLRLYDLGISPAQGKTVIDASNLLPSVELQLYYSAAGKLEFIGSDHYDSVGFSFGDRVIDGGGGYDSASMNCLAGSNLLVSGDGDVLEIAGQGMTTSLVNGEDLQLTVNTGCTIDAGSTIRDLQFSVYSMASVVAGSGNDSFYLSSFGDDGNTTLTGGHGADRYQFYDLSNEFDLTHITDFARTDIVSFGIFDAVSYVGGDEFTGAGMEVRYAFADGHTELQFDRDGDREADATLFIDNGMFFLGEAFPGSNQHTLKILGQYVEGGAGSDALRGTAGADVVFGLAGNDALSGGLGMDVLSGGAGQDRLTGGAGADTFFFDGRSGSDTIADFSAVEGDKIQLDVRGIKSFSDLTITSDHAGGALVTCKAVTIDVKGVKPSDLHSTDFVFAAMADPPGGRQPTSPADVPVHRFDWDVIAVHHAALV